MALTEQFTPNNDGAIESEILTFAQSGLTDADKGKPVKLNGNNSVALCADGDQIVGFIVTVQNDTCGVKIDGIHRATYTGAAPAVGWNTLVADNAGGVKTAASTINRLILEVDTTAKEVVFVIGC